MKQHISHKNNSRLWRVIFVAIIITVCITTAFSQKQPLSITEMTDSIVALLPQLSGDDKLEAITSLVRLTDGTPAEN